MNDVGIVGSGDCWPDSKKEDHLSASGGPGSLSYECWCLDARSR